MYYCRGEVLTLPLRRPLFFIEEIVMESDKSFADELCSRIWKTKGARFNKSRRYKNNNKLSSASIAILTLCVFAITLAEYMGLFAVGDHGSKVAIFTSMVLSIFILILSLLESCRSYEVKAERLYNCANDLTVLYNRLRQIVKSSDPDKDASVANINDEYDNILQKYPENHDPKDYQLLQAEHYKEFDLNWFESQLIKIKYCFSSYWLYFLLPVSPLLVLFLSMQ